jgi:hypothetical protein
MVGHKFGEFAPTRMFYGHSSDQKAKRTADLPRRALLRRHRLPRQRAER